MMRNRLFIHFCAALLLGVATNLPAAEKDDQSALDIVEFVRTAVGEAVSISGISFKPDTSPDAGTTVTSIRLKQILPRMQAAHFQQVTFDYDAGQVRDTDWGQFQVDSRPLRGVRKHPRAGYINLFLANTEDGQLSWSVENLFLPKQLKRDNRLRSKRHDSSVAHQPEVEGTSPVESAISGADSGLRGKAMLRRGPRMSVYFDLRPGLEGSGPVTSVSAVVLFSEQPLPVIAEILDLAASFTPQIFPVEQVVHDAEGALAVDEDLDSTPPPPVTAATIGPPPQPSIPGSSVPSDLSFPLEVIQANVPNVDTAKNQCVPMAYANVLQYLEDRYDGLPLAWNLPDVHIPGFGEQQTLDDILLLTWIAVPDNSLVANIDAFTRRLFATDNESGNGSSVCQGIRGVFGNLTAKGPFDQVVVRHRGSADQLGAGTTCDGVAGIDLGDLVSTKEGDFPTWEWIFEQLQLGRGVALAFGRFTQQGERYSGHMLRVFGAARYNNKNYLYLIDDRDQGNNSVGTSDPRQWEVRDIGNGSLGFGGIGNFDGRLNINNNLAREIEFAISFEAKPTLLIP